MVPDRWKSSPLGNLCLLITDGKHGDCENEDNSGFYFLSARDINDGNLSYANARQITQRDFIETHNRTKLKSGDVLLCNTGSIGKIARAAEDPRTERTTFQKSVAVIKSDPSISDTNYLYYFLDLHKQELERRATGSSQKNLLLGELKNIKVSYPRELKEQKKIARILSAWDKAIETVEKLIENSKAQKKALMQQFLTGKQRFREFQGKEWREVRIGDLLREVKRNLQWDDNREYHLLSVRRRSEGIFLREILPGHKILTKKMKRASSGDFLISKMQIVHGATGVVLEPFDGMHISDSYIALISKNPGELDVRFFDWLSRTKRSYYRTYLCSYGVHIEKMTFNFRMFLKEKILIPPTLDEQQKIINILENSEEQIRQHEEQKRVLLQEKRSLMQQLLTGKRRVKVDEA